MKCTQKRIEVMAKLVDKIKDYVAAYSAMNIGLYTE